MNKLNFGTAGIPVAARGDGTEAGIAKVKELGLDAMELEFVRSVNIKEARAALVKKAKEEHDVILTCHAPYWVNLNAQDSEKLQASQDRLFNASRIAALCGGWSTCVHAAFYLKMDKEEVYRNVKKQFEQVQQRLADAGLDIWIRPETAGKFTQWGTLPEIVKLSSELDKVLPCIDFGHMRATTGANSLEAYSDILSTVETHLGKEGLHNLHIHTEGINFGDKGEKNHINLKDSDMNYEALCQAWNDFDIRGVVISESPNLEEDAKLLQRTYHEL